MLFKKGDLVIRYDVPKSVGVVVRSSEANDGRHISEHARLLTSKQEIYYVYFSDSNNVEGPLFGNELKKD